ncbi:MAG: hypothetical protein A2Y07_11570 [Planctomycetes bacterium GWF2_50_10]|nr:MAG: hypothetical protein A2Y07_11570 [Planctomycetes bacterium GWF2_50_10]
MKIQKEYLIAISLICFCQQLYAWENRFTHPAITEKAVKSNGTIINNYLTTQFGLSDGLSAQLYWNFPSAIEKRLKAGGADPGIKTRTVLEWIKAGSNIEDMDGIRSPTWRARHHFYDSIRNSGLDNQTEHPNWSGIAYKATGWLPIGQSALEWATWGQATQEPTTNDNEWSDARDAFNDALTKTTKAEREESLAMAMLDLGCVLHMLGDMGVPAHARNDFIWGHVMGSVFGGNAFEKWVEKRVQANNNAVPSTFMGETVQPVAFSRLDSYWDTEAYTGQYIGTNPSDNWGLAEATNYQFLSTSTIFRANVNDTKYYFPQPDFAHMETTPTTGYLWYKRAYLKGYGVDHQARKLFIEKYQNNPPPYQPDENSDYTVDDDDAIYNDYAKITIPRTINYAAGLANYFFRGKIEAEQTGSSGDIAEITVKNLSKNGDVEQVLKGGQWSLYWDDQDGNRVSVESTVIILEPDGTIWNSESILHHNETTKIEFVPVTTPEGKYIERYILIYKGAINSQDDPNNTDADDSEAIATTLFYASCDYSNLNCGCFLDPCTPRWESNHAYDINDVVWSYSSNGIWKNLIAGNLYWPDAGHGWARLTSANPYGNMNWNSVPPFGGIGKTPMHYILEMRGVTKVVSKANCSGVERNGAYPTTTLRLTYRGSIGSSYASCWSTHNPNEPSPQSGMTATIIFYWTYNSPSPYTLVEVFDLDRTNPCGFYGYWPHLIFKSIPPSSSAYPAAPFCAISDTLSNLYGWSWNWYINGGADGSVSIRPQW